MKISHKRKINHKYQRHHTTKHGPTACFIDGSAIDIINTTCGIVGGFVAVTQAPKAYRTVTNGIRRNVLGRFLSDAKEACKLTQNGKVCNASTKLIQITLKDERTFFARQCSENPAHLVDANGIRIKLNNLSEKQREELFL
ncbi:hypothetical protein [Pseudoalteromonas rhizosphaerae]|uniref:hypothetical protein n=1 Tax=Pseudoalteromonas rhizosphaerae TaxID=2518973 RepID=UPI00370454F0